MHTLLKTTCEIPLQKENTLRLTEKVNPVLSNKCRRRLRYMHMQSFDWDQGGLLSPIKFIDRDSVEYSLMAAADGKKNEEKMAKLTLDKAMALIDPIWGGVYQYSTLSKWNAPHCRKTMATQAGHLRLYSLAYAHMKSNDYLNVTSSIQTYIKNFMTSENGAFYTSQSGNIGGMSPIKYFSLKKTQREKIGFPEIDKRVLTRENGWIIEALATHAEYCSDKKRFNNISKHGLRYLSIPEIATARIEEAGVLIIDREMQTPPLTININGGINNRLVIEFINIAHKQEGWYKLIRLNESENVSAFGLNPWTIQ